MKGERNLGRAFYRDLDKRMALVGRGVFIAVQWTAHNIPRRAGFDWRGHLRGPR